MVEIDLLWPDRSLSPNAQKRHWRDKQPAKVDRYLYAKGQALEHHGKIGKENLHAWLTFYPPDKRRRDLDNLLASMKSDFDGLCDGLGINDLQIKRITLEWGDKQDPARVHIDISPLLAIQQVKEWMEK